jgi:hypothetical protein
MSCALIYLNVCFGQGVRYEPSVLRELKDSFEADRCCAIADGRFFRGDQFIRESAARYSQHEPFCGH